MKIIPCSTLLHFLVVCALSSFLFINPGTGSAHWTPLKDTGVQKCYNDKDVTPIPCPSTGEPFYGQDASYSGAEASFTDLNDGTIVLDNTTRLMWEKTGDIWSKKWEQAQAYCSDLDLGGYTDWRLPEIWELTSIRDYATTEIASAIYPNFVLQNGAYWSVTEYAEDSTQAWNITYQVHIFENPADKSKDYKVRCVRGTSSYHNFTANNDQTVTDNLTGLVWQQSDNGIEYGWKDALEYCENLTLANRSDWRLPNLRELKSIISYSHAMPAVDPTFQLRPDFYHCSTKDPLYPDQLWLLRFTTGVTHGGSSNHTDYVVCVAGESTVSKKPVGINSGILMLLLSGNN
ncbi:MAG: DUF1566 domain-containing protein [Candidatus Electrothrix sp. AUS1_2]|nr:DUF1566 domain-containing protein [Candidatus Electrothrix sp. AUS1_2]